MRILRKPQTNAVIISVVSIFYALVFIIISGHLEFERILNHAETLNSPFWNGWSIFLKQGNMKYIGYAYENSFDYDDIVGEIFNPTKQSG